MSVLAAILLALPAQAEDLKARLRDAKGPAEKAQAVRSIGGEDLRDPAAVQALARFLSPCASDCNYLVPAAAVETLSRCKGSPAASRVLLAAAASYKKNPYMQARIRSALSQVGHESGLAFFLEDLDGGDSVAAIRSISEFPPALSVECLVREGERLQKRGEAEGGIPSEILKALQKVTGEKYPSLAEFGLWWKKRGAAFREEAAGREGPPQGPSPLPPGAPLLVELLFRENSGASTANTGASCGLLPTASVTSRGPAWTGAAPVNAGPAALEWDKAGGAQAVDLGGAAGIENLKGLKSFTLSGWLLVTDPKEAPGGNRILTWLNPSKSGEGAELVLRADGSLQLGLHQPADGSPLRTPPAQVPALDPKAKESIDAWRFFAVTVNATEPSGQVKLYVGGWNADARRVATHDCLRATSGTKIAPGLTVGNVSPAVRSAAPRGFRGTIDEIRIFGSSTDGAGALSPEDVIRVQNRRTPN